MAPGTVIQFDDNNTPIITAKVSFDSTPILLPKEWSEEDDKKLADEEAFLESVYKEAEKYPVVELKNPIPCPGMIVTYGIDGGILNIKYPESSSTKGMLPQGTRKPPGTYKYPANKNTQKITITSSAVTGEGRFTVFNDSIGDHGNYLKTGDVATKGEIDNPWYGTKLDTRALNTNVAKVMTKNDCGSLPEAVLDVWKWSGTMYGYTYSSTLSFPGRYYYQF